MTDSEFSIRHVANRFRVIEIATGLVWRTLETRDEANAWAAAATK